MSATIATHNGSFTIVSTRSGEHRTFRVRTQKPDAKFAPGSRVVSMLSGPDNYQGFGFVNENGSVCVWRSKRGGAFDAYATLLEKMAGHAEAGNIEVMAETKCRCCNRSLTNPESIESGIGPICAAK